MTTARWLIDDSGDVLTSGSQAIAERLGVPPEGRVEDYAVENIGCIGLSLRRDTWHVRYRPAIVSERAMAGLFYWLLDHPPRPMAISWLEGVWRIERVADTRAAIAFLSYMMELRRKPLGSNAHRIQSRPSLQAQHRWEKVRDAVVPLVEPSGVSTMLYTLLDRCFAGRWSLIDVIKGQVTAEIAHQGTGYPPLDPVFTNHTAGYRLEKLADEQYRSWINTIFLDVAEAGQPRFDDVDAVIYWPRFGDMRTRYWRLIVPIQRTASSCRILSASGNDSGIDLRPEAVEELSEVGGSVVGGHP